MIEKEQILLLTQGGLNVFSHFLGFEVNLHRNFRSPFYDDKRASCHIYYDRKTSSYKVVSLKVCNSSFLSLYFHCYFILFFPVFELIYSPFICCLCFLHRHGCQEEDDGLL